MILLISISRTVLHITATPEGKYFVSLYIENLVASYYEGGMQKKITKYIMNTETDSVHASTRGFLFEAVAHQILTRGGEFQVQ